MSRLPSDLYPELLLYLDYPFLRKLERVFDSIFSSERFWFRKAQQLGVTEAQWKRRREREPHLRYIEAISYYTKHCFLECEPYLGATECLVRSAGLGDLELVKYFIEREPGDLNIACLRAAKHSHFEVMKYIYMFAKKAGKLSPQTTMLLSFGLAKQGEETWIKWLESKHVVFGWKDTDRLAEGAAAGGHIELVRLWLSELFPEQKFIALAAAARSGQVEAFVYIKTQLGSHFIPREDLSIAAAQGGNGEILSHCGTDYRHMLIGAARGGHLNLVKQIMKSSREELSADTRVDAESLRQALGEAVADAHVDCIRYLTPIVDIDPTVTTPYELIKVSRELFDCLLECNLADPNSLFIAAIENGNIDLLEYILPHHPDVVGSLTAAALHNRYVSIYWMFENMQRVDWEIGAALDTATYPEIKRLLESKLQKS